MSFSPQCGNCKHLQKDGTCTAFPKGIPYKILEAQHDHREPYEGDGGVRFEPREPDK